MKFQIDKIQFSPYIIWVADCFLSISSTIFIYLLFNYTLGVEINTGLMRNVILLSIANKLRHNTPHHGWRALTHLLCNDAEDALVCNILSCNTRICRKVHIHAGDNRLHVFGIPACDHARANCELLLHDDTKPWH